MFRMHRGGLLLFAAVAAVASLAGCTRGPEARRYQLQGQVLAVRVESSEILVRHEDIVGFMPAMTMPYRVKEAGLLKDRVPGDLITDLQRAGAIGDPLYELNFKSLAWDATFTYRLAFDASAALLAAPARWLVLDSVKMGAWVWLNGRFLGAVADQFLRYEFDVSAVLEPTDNELLVTFPPSNHALNDEARWIACSGAWDWAP